MALPPKKPATLQDLEAVPDHLVGGIVDGELHASPRPSLVHADAQEGLVAGEEEDVTFRLFASGPSIEETDEMGDKALSPTVPSPAG